MELSSLSFLWDFGSSNGQSNFQFERTVIYHFLNNDITLERLSIRKII